MIRRWQGFVEGDGQPRPNVPAYATMSWLLDGATFERTERRGPQAWVHYFKTDRGPLAVAWTHTGAEVRLDLPHVVQAWDLMGAPLAVPRHGPLTIADAPVYLLLEN